MIYAAGIIASGPRLSLVLTYWLSITAGRRFPSDPLLDSPEKEVVHVMRLRGAWIAVPMTRTSVCFQERAAFVVNDRDGRIVLKKSVLLRACATDVPHKHHEGVNGGRQLVQTRSVHLRTSGEARLRK